MTSTAKNTLENKPSQITTNKRQHFVDILRGFSLLGILIVNIEYIVQAAETGWSSYTSDLDLFIRWLLVTTAQVKIYPLFALLFGFGLSLQRSRQSTDLTSRYRRRMIGLLFLGVLHGIFFFPGDILVLYAIIGFFAYRFRETPTRTLLKISASVYITASTIWISIGILDLSQTHTTATVSPEALATLSQGSFLEVATQQLGYWVVTFGILTLIQGPAVLALFLTGIALGRTDLLKEPNKYKPLSKKVLLLGMPFAFLTAGVGAAMEVYFSPRWGTLGFALGFTVAPLITASYIAALSLCFGNNKNQLARLFRNSGRMSLTIYLAESIIVAFLSYGYGGGLFGNVNPAEGLFISVLVWGVLALFATVWLKKFTFGPFEWLLRSFTYKKWQHWS